MTHTEFRAWMRRNKLSAPRAASVLGLSPNTVRNYYRGMRHDQGSPVVIPVGIAAQAQSLDGML